MTKIIQGQGVPQISIQYVSIGKLKKYEQNVKFHTKKQIKKLVSSMKQFGVVTPINFYDKYGQKQEVSKKIHQAELRSMINMEEKSELLNNFDFYTIIF